MTRKLPRSRLSSPFQALSQDWFMEWPEEALRSVASHFLHKVELQHEVFLGVVEICVRMQESVFELTERFRLELQRHYYVTPTSYLELINSFKEARL